MAGIVFSVLGIIAFAALGYAVTRQARKDEQDRSDKWADYEHRKRQP